MGNLLEKLCFEEARVAEEVTIEMNLNPFPIEELQKEILEIVLRHLPQNDILNLRLINSAWKAKVDTLYDQWTIRVDETCPYLDWILHLRVKKAIIVQLLHPMEFRPQKTIFEYPNLLRKIVFSDEDYEPFSEEDSSGCQVSPMNGHILLKSKYLQSLTLSIDVTNSNSDLIQDYCAQSRSGYNFPELLKLKMHITNFGQSYEKSRSFFHWFLSATFMPKLRSLKIWADITDISEIQELDFIKALISFLSRYGQGLKKFEFQEMNCAEFSEPFENLSSPLPPKELKVLKNCCALRSLQVHVHEHPTYTSVVIELAKCQTKLLYLRLTGGIPVSTKLLSELIANNFQGLVTIALDGVDLDRGSEHYLNMTVFRNCANLKNLSLCSHSHGHNILALNFHLLPPKLERVRLALFSLYSAEITEFLNDHDKLHTFTCELGGGGTLYGVDGTGLGLILNHPTLQLVFLDEKNINVCDPEDLEKVSEIFEELGCRRSWWTGNFCFQQGLSIKRDGFRRSNWRVECWDDWEGF